MGSSRIGLALATIPALYVVGMTAWIWRRYTARLRQIVQVGDRRSGLLPAHVALVSAWAVIALLRMIARDQYVDHAPPLWLGWPMTVLLATWLGAALFLLASHYRRESAPKLRHPAPE